MARPSEWIQRVPAILASLANIPPLITTAWLADALHVSRRQACRIAASIPSCLIVGRHRLIPREALCEALRAALRDPDHAANLLRRRRVATAITDARDTHIGRSVKIAVTRVEDGHPPVGVRFECGRFVVEYSTFDDLLSTLYAYGRFCASDPDRARRFAEGE